MKHDQFIGQVQHHARLSSRGEAERATRATLETLAEHLVGGEADDLDAKLPLEIGEHLRWRSWRGERFSLAEFFQRVSMREGVDLPEATFHVRAVMEVVREAVSQGEIDDVRAQLPREFDPLFEGGSTEH